MLDGGSATSGSVRRVWVVIFAFLFLAGCVGPGEKKRYGNGPDLTSIANPPTHRHHPGKIVWHDLLSPDPVASMRFYAGLFGWSFQSRGRYREIYHGGRRIGGIVAVETKRNQEMPATWMISLSVPDVEQAVVWVESQGGRVLRGPVDMPERGWGALIRDPWGADLVVLHARSGDPEDREPDIGDWLWNEVWTLEMASVTRFYERLGHYEGVLEGAGYAALINEGVWRAGVRQIGQKAFSGQWIPVVRVEDPASLLEKVESLGGLVWVRPGEKLDQRDAVLISDNLGALLILQRWDFSGAGPEQGS